MPAPVPLHGETLLVPERVIIAPAVGVFRPRMVDPSGAVCEGDEIGVVEGPGTSASVRSPFEGTIMGMLVHEGERLRQGQPVAWLGWRDRAAGRDRRLGLRSTRRPGHERRPRSACRHDRRVDRRTQRHPRAPHRRAGETTATLATEAAATAIKRAGLAPDDIDLLIVATASPEQPLPHTGAFVGEALGMRCGSFDLAAACAGFVYELVVGASMVGIGYEHVLLVGAETLSRIIDPEDRSTLVLFGDGAGAAVITRTSGDAPSLLGWDLGCDGSAAGILEIPAGGSRRPASADTVAARGHYLKMQGREVFRRAVARSSTPRTSPSTAPGSTSTTSRGSCRTRPTYASSNRRRNDSASRRAHARQHRALRQHVLGIDPARAVRSRRRRSRARRRPPAVLRLRRRE